MRSKKRDTGANVSLTEASGASGQLQLLQHRVGPARREHVARQQQHRQPVDRRQRRAGDHVRRARPDRRALDQHGDGRGAGNDQPAACAAAAGSVFASRRPNPVLQQLELPGRPEASVNDTLAPVSRFDRVNRRSLPFVLLEVHADRPGHAGAVTIALPQDVQAEAANFPDHCSRGACGTSPGQYLADTAVALLQEARRPADRGRRGPALLPGGRRAAGAGRATGIPVAETQAGKGAMPFSTTRRRWVRWAPPGRRHQPGQRGAGCWRQVGDFHHHWPHGIPGSRSAADARCNVSGFNARELGSLPSVADAPQARAVGCGAERVPGGRGLFRPGRATQPRVGRRGGAADGAGGQGRPPRRR